MERRRERKARSCEGEGGETEEEGATEEDGESAGESDSLLPPRSRAKLGEVVLEGLAVGVAEGAVGFGACAEDDEKRLAAATLGGIARATLPRTCLSLPV